LKRVLTEGHKGGKTEGRADKKRGVKLISSPLSGSLKGPIITTLFAH